MVRAMPAVGRNAVCGACVERLKAWLRETGAVSCADCGRVVHVVSGAVRCVPCRMAHTAKTEIGGAVVVVSSGGAL